MNAHVNSLLVSAGICLASVHSGTAGESPGALLDEIMDKPGSWNQICMGPEPMPFDAPVPVFSGLLVWRYFDLGSKEGLQLQAKRSEVVPALVEVLKRMDLARPPKVTRGPTKGDFSEMRSGLKAEWLNALHLQIIHELSAVETLPELLRLEAQLHGQLEAAERDASSALPALPLDSPASFETPGDKKKEEKWWESAEYKRDKEIFTCGVFQRELLGTMTLLLRNEEFAPAKEKFEPMRQVEHEKRLKEARQKVAASKEDLSKKEKFRSRRRRSRANCRGSAAQPCRPLSGRSIASTFQSRRM